MVGEAGRPLVVPASSRMARNRQRRRPTPTDVCWLVRQPGTTDQFIRTANKK